MNIWKERLVEDSVQWEVAYTVAMDWREYEGEIEAQFRHAYPSARITRDAKLLGKFSKVERQIDVLIEEQASDFAFRIVVDAKYRGRKIDVGDVESFIGLTRDVEAHTGMMVALEGYTPAAVNRAHNDDLDVILDVLNLDQLKEFQGPTAIPYSGEYGVWIAAPFGWVIDATKRPHMLASIYQRGLTFEEAVRSDEWMYVNFWKKRGSEVNSLDSLLTYQSGYMLSGSVGSEIQIIEEGKNQRMGVKTLIRRFRKNAYPAPEYTGFVDFDDFVFMCVLFTPERLERKNLRKLRFILRDAFPMSVTHNHEARITAAEAKLKGASSIEERAKLLAQIGFWHREMRNLQESKRALEESLSLIPNYYYALEELRLTLIRIGDKEAMLEAMGKLVRLDPHNPTVFDDCIAYASGGPMTNSDVLSILDGLKKDYPDDHLVCANSDFYSGRILIETDPTSAREHFAAAQERFRKVFPPEHQVFAAIQSGLTQLSQNKS
jgi:tetratricopeptide (TPR) repeat protein